MPIRLQKARNDLLRRSGHRRRQPVLGHSPELVHPAIPLALFPVLGAGILALLAWLVADWRVGRLLSWNQFITRGWNPDVTKTTFGAAAFFGAILTGVYAYRKQRHVEGDAARADAQLLADRYARAAEQLGSGSAAVRLAGVYAMASLADDWDAERQTCVDVLCAYLRMPFGSDAGIGGVEGDRAEWQVRSAILKAISTRVSIGRRTWSDCEFDFSRAELPDCNFIGSTFEGIVDFSRAHFRDGVMFSLANLSKAYVLFDDAIFDGSTDFGAARLGKVSFRNARFNGRTSFARAKFSQEADFDDARFKEFTDFEETVFEGRADFTGATFGDHASFRETCFSGSTRFSRSEFKKQVSFSKAASSGRDHFFGVEFHGWVDLSYSTVGLGPCLGGCEWGVLGPRRIDDPAHVADWHFTLSDYASGTEE